MQKKKEFVSSSKISVHLIFTKSELILFLWIKLSSIFNKIMSENLMDYMWNKESGLHQVISVYYSLLTFVFHLTFQFSIFEDEKILSAGQDQRLMCLYPLLPSILFLFSTSSIWETKARQSGPYKDKSL